jgi:hypothetical protein
VSWGPVGDTFTEFPHVCPKLRDIEAFIRLAKHPYPPAYRTTNSLISDSRARLLRRVVIVNELLLLLSKGGKWQWPQHPALRPVFRCLWGIRFTASLLLLVTNVLELEEPLRRA